jgi:predicted phage terminase large subunit-like protein
MNLTSDAILGFSGAILSQRYDNPQPTPDFHKELWDYCTSEHKKVAVAAPRGHAKSTAVTHAYVLAEVLFRKSSFVMIVSDTEGQAVQFLHDIKVELTENEDLKHMFGISKLLKDTETEVVVRTKDRHQFKIIAKGSGQKVRGTKWLGKRPDLIIGDDLENEDLVMNQERREKFRNWFYGALLPAGGDTCRIRIVGTILHLDSLLERLLNSSNWVSHRYQAHNEDFSFILWPEKFPEERLVAIRKDYLEEGFPEGYYQEYLNLPIDPTNAYFKKDDFIEITDNDLEVPLNYYAAADFAISQKEKADRTVITVGGVDSENKLHIVHCVVGRWDAKEIIENMIAVQKRYNPEIFTVEAGMIEKSLGPYLNEEMFRTGTFLNLNKLTPVKDKETRARSIQARMRAGGVKFDKEADWYPEMEAEMLVFPKGRHDDIVDSMAWLGQTVDKFAIAPTVEEQLEYEWEEEVEDTFESVGICATTGY